MSLDQFKGQLKVFFDVRKKRIAQDAQWGGPAHDDAYTSSDFLDYIDRQVSKADAAQDWPTRRDKLISIAGLAFAAVESMDRRAAAETPEIPAEYSWEVDGREYFEGNLASIPEAIAEAIREEKTGNVRVGRVAKPTPAHGLGETILEQIEDRLYDECGEIADRFSYSAPQHTELSALIETWAEANIDYSCWQVVDVREYTPDSPEYLAALARIEDTL